MKKFLIPAAILAALSAQPAVAEDAHHPAEKKAAPAAQTKKPAPSKESMAMMDNMKTMQAQMEKMRNTTDPKEREKLMQEHSGSKDIEKYKFFADLASMQKEVRQVTNLPALHAVTQDPMSHHVHTLQWLLGIGVDDPAFDGLGRI